MKMADHFLSGCDPLIRIRQQEPECSHRRLSATVG
jgi:hypothetical protein